MRKWLPVFRKLIQVNGPYKDWQQLQFLVWPSLKFQIVGKSPGREVRPLLHLYFARCYPFILLIE